MASRAASTRQVGGREEGWSIARLIHLNGAPGSGKSTLARRYVEDHPLVLLLELDAIRMALGGWRDHQESMSLARGLALSMAEVHLRAGHDVVVPQYIGRPEFIDSLDDVARRTAAAFVEVLLEVSQELLTERFRARRQQLGINATSHPQDDVADEAVEAVIADAVEHLRRIVASRPTITVISAADEADTSYSHFRSAVGATRA